MSDEFDAKIERITERMAVTYAGLMACCERLPLPIKLPTGNIGGEHAIAAVRRVTEIARDQPIPEEQQAYLYGSCIQWLVAIDLLGLQLIDEHVDREPGIELNLRGAYETLIALAAWLMESED
jgi:hypothetical protein